jgi:hypothetical protein
VHRFTPELDGPSSWMNRWKVGTLETLRTLDVAAGAVVHAECTDAQLADPAYVISDHVRTTLLVMFGFEENLARLRRLLDNPDTTSETVAPLVDALLLDLANELLAANTPGWMGDAETLELPLPRLDALERLAFTVDDYDSLAGQTLRTLAARLLFLAGSQTSWWEAIPPFRWMRRGPASRRRITDAIARFVGTAFGAAADTALEASEQLADTLAADHRKQRKAYLAGKRRPWAIEQARLPIAPLSITSDTELLATPRSRVMPADEYATICAHKLADRVRRKALLATAAEQHAQLFVKR